jgi:hypothetical protein
MRAHEVRRRDMPTRALTDLEEHMMRAFTHGGVGDNGVQSFAHDHGFAAELLDQGRVEVDYTLATDYESHATCRGGGRLLRRREDVAEGPAWIVDLESGGYRRRWGLDHRLAMDSRTALLRTAAAFAAVLAVVLLVAYLAYATK